MKKLISPAALCLALITTGLSTVMAQDVAKVSQALPFATKGQVDLTEAALDVSNSQAVQITTQAKPPIAITAGGTIRTDASGSASVTLSGIGTVQMERNTEIQIPAEPDAKHSLELLKGKLLLRINAEDLQKRQAGEFRLKTPTALLAVKGTRFFVDCDKKSDTVGLHEGSVSVLEPDSQSTALLVPNQAVTVSAGSISAPRPLTDKEKKNAGTLEEIGTVNTPLMVETSGGKKGSMIFWQGKVGPRPSSARGTLGFLITDLEHVSFAYNASDKSSNELMVDGTMVIVREYDYLFAKRGTTSKTLAAALENYQVGCTSSMHFKGDVWRAKNAGLSQIGPLIGMQVRLRLKNVAKLSCYIGTATQSTIPSDGVISFSAPPGLATGATWEQACVIPCTVDKTGENSKYRLYLFIHPEGPRDAAGNLRQDIATVSLSGISLISRSR
jgi:FecR-like protein